MYISYDIRSWVSVWNCFSFLFPHIFVWGSCFWFCIPPPSPPPPAASSSNLSTHNLLTHNLLTQNCPHTTCPHTTCSHTTCPHTTCSHTTCHIQLVHTQLVHTQLWHLVTSTLRGRRGSYGTGRALVAHRVLSWRRGRRGSLRGRRGTWRQPPSLCVAGVALGDIDRHFAWQAWLLRHWAGSGGAPGSQLMPWTPRLFAWQAWHLATATFTWRGRRGTWRQPPSLCVAGVALTALGGLWWRTGFSADVVDAAALCVAGVALGDSHLHFAWQAWHLVTSTVTMRGRRGSYGTGPALVAHRVRTLSPTIFRHTIFHTPLHTIFQTQSLTHPLSHTIFVTHYLSRTHHLSHTVFHAQLCHTPSFTQHFVTHHLWHTIFHTTLSHTLSFTHHFVTHHLSHTTFDTPSFTHHLWHTIFHTPSQTHLLHTTLSTLSHTILHHTIFHTPLCHPSSFATPSFTHHFVTYHLHTHTTLSHTIFHTQLSHTTLSHTHTIFPIQLCHTHNFVLLLDPPPPPLSFLSSPSPLQHLVLIIGRSCLVGLSGPLILRLFVVLAFRCREEIILHSWLGGKRSYEEDANEVLGSPVIWTPV